MSFEIRRMQQWDLEEVLAIENLSFSSPWSRSAFLNEIQGCHAHPFVMVREPFPHVVGYLCCWIVLDECHILNLAVHSDFRRTGAASGMIDHLIKFCRENGVDRYYLEVRMSNQQAITLYEKFGFYICGVRRGYYPDTGEDALIMHRGTTCS